MKTTLLLFAVIFGYVTPTYSQLDRPHETGVTLEQLQIKKSYDFSNYRFEKFGNFKVDKFGDFLSNRERDSFSILPTRHAPSNQQGQYIKQNNMPCFHPKSGDRMPCLKPTDTFPMRIFNPDDVIWGILW